MATQMICGVEKYNFGSLSSRSIVSMLKIQKIAKLKNRYISSLIEAQKVEK
jgi:hypothetical protein